MTFHVLGTLEIRDRDGTTVALPRQKQRALLAYLLVHAGRVVSSGEIEYALWGERPPASARANLYSYMSGLRAVLDRATATGHPRPRLVSRGYRLDVSPQECDADVFEQLVAGGRTALAAGDWAVAAGQLARGLALWRGDVLAGLEPYEWSLAYTTRLEQARLAAIEDWVEARLMLGQHVELAAELVATTARYPLRERLWGQYIVALQRAGRREEALRAYERLAGQLTDELGVRPDATLRRLNDSLRSGEVGLEPSVEPRQQREDPHPGPRVVAPEPDDEPDRAVVVPRQLPAPVPRFAGRADLLRRLDGLLADGASAVVVSGTAGVGKTSLAVHWARQVSDRFPDGQFYLNLHGFDETDEILDAGQALYTLFEALGVPARRVPPGLDAQVGLYRSILARRRVLVVLDNARDAEQVRPLLPGSATCLALVTSRNRLAGLVAVDGAQPLAVGLPSADEARTMLARRLDDRRVDTQPDAAAELIAACARLPIALAVVAARAAELPHFGLDAIAAELRKTRGVMNAYPVDDPRTDLRAVFSWSYRTLSPAAARLFRLLGLHPCRQFTVPAVAATAALSEPRARAALTELARANLITEPAADRYTFHDLLRAYAAELAHDSESAADRDAATRRVLDHYLHRAAAADEHIRTDRSTLIKNLVRDYPTDTFADPAQAMAWFTDEHDNLLAAVRHAAGHGHAGYAWRIAQMLEGYFDWRGQWHELDAVQRIAADVAAAEGDLAGEAHTRYGLARSAVRQNAHQDALRQLETALELFRRQREPLGEARVESGFGFVLARLERHTEALWHDRRALELFRECGDLPGLERQLNNVGYQYYLMGDYDKALDHCEEALTRARAAGRHRDQTVAILDSLGCIHSRLGNHTEAIAYLRKAIPLFLARNDRINAADTYINLGDAYAAVGDRPAAHDALDRAVTLLEQLGHADAAGIRERREALAGPGAGSASHTASCLPTSPA